MEIRADLRNRNNNGDAPELNNKRTSSSDTVDQTTDMQSQSRMEVDPTQYTIM